MLNSYSSHSFSLPSPALDMIPAVLQSSPLPPTTSPRHAHHHNHNHHSQGHIKSSSATANGTPNSTTTAHSSAMTNPYGSPSTFNLPSHALECLEAEINNAFASRLTPSALQCMSQALQDQFAQKLRCSTECMLPSYNYTLPSGREKGTYLAFDVGGSGLRVALVVLEGPGMRIARLFNYRIDSVVRSLRGTSFFDWMAERIEEALEDDEVRRETQGLGALRMGVAWSFPVEQTSIRHGNLLEMGKGFYATEGLKGQDLGELIMRSCRKKNLNVRMDAIINDSSATLLCRAYADPTTRLALILGTGTNAAVILPVSCMDKSKYGKRPQSWHDAARHVLVNTELSMFGKDILPTTRWDDRLNYTHMCPDYQPLEYLISGRYLGEIVRLVLMDAIKEAGLFQGCVPEKFEEPYALETSTVAAFEADDSPELGTAASTLLAAHPLPSSSLPATTDLIFVRRVVQAVSRRAATYLAVGIHALWNLRQNVNAAGAECGSNGEMAAVNGAIGDESISIGCNGSVIERYPKFRSRCQSILDGWLGEGKVRLEVVVESALYGAAVAVACLEGEE